MNSQDRYPTRFAVLSGLIALIVSAIVVFVAGSTRQPSGQVAVPDRYGEIRQRGSIKAAFFVGAPYFSVEPNTKKKAGIFFETVELAGKRLGLSVEWTEEVGFGEMAEGLRAKRFDIVGSGIWINAARAKDADFTIPVLYDIVSAYVRPSDHRFDADLRTINDPAVRISTIDGEMAASIAQADFPLAHTVSQPQTTDFTQMIETVATKKADVTFLGLAAARKYERANPGKLRNLSPNRPLRVFPTAIMLPAGQYRLKATLDLVLLEMLNNGEVESIIRANEEVAGSHYRVAPPFQVPAVK